MLQWPPLLENSHATCSQSSVTWHPVLKLTNKISLVYWACACIMHKPTGNFTLSKKCYNLRWQAFNVKTSITKAGLSDKQNPSKRWKNIKQTKPPVPQRKFCDLMKEAGKKYRLMSKKFSFSQTYMKSAVAMARSNMIDSHFTYRNFCGGWIMMSTFSNWKFQSLKVHRLFRNLRIPCGGGVVSNPNHCTSEG